MTEQTEHTPASGREGTEAQQAMAAALAIAAAAEAQVRTAATAHLVGRISLADFADFAATLILRGMARARLVGAYFAGREWSSPATGEYSLPAGELLITEADQDHIRRALATITETSPAAVTNVTPAGEPPATDADASPAGEPELIMRSTRLAHAETVTAGREGYATATADALGNVEHFWHFEPSAKACGRCLELAAKRFDAYEDAPKDAGHPNCTCTLTAELIPED